MSAPSPRYILTRATFLIVAIIVALFCLSFYKKKQRQAAILTQLKSLCSESSYFQQFYAEDAQKTLIKAIGLLAEIKQIGIPSQTAVDRGLGIEGNLFATDTRAPDPTPRQMLIRNNLNTNYDNFLKLGYTEDFITLQSLKEGNLPSIPTGPQAGRKPVIATLIDPSLSPGLEKVIANLVIRPADSEGPVSSDIQTAAAKQLARGLYDARLIEEPVKDRILKALSPPVAPPATPLNK
jgi:hypothetical protein